MKYRIAVLLASSLLSACANGPTYLGYPISEASFKVDGGKTVSLPVTRAGALPAENSDYKIEGAGFSAALEKGKPNESKLTWGFSFVSKKAAELDSVVVEQVTAAGELELVVKDNAPILKRNNWVGRSAPVSMAKDVSPWLYSGDDSTFVFKFTIRAKDGNSIEMYQPSIIASRLKSVYLQVLSGN